MIDAGSREGDIVIKARFWLPFWAVALQLPLAAAPLEAADQEVRDLAGFNAIEVGGDIDVIIKQGETFRVEVNASNGRAEDVLTEVESNTLEIRRRRNAGGGFLGWFVGYSVSVTLPELVSLSVSGNSDVASEGALSGDRLNVTASGGADVVLEVTVGELDVQASGGSDTTLSGTADILHVSASGGSDLNARALQARDARLETSDGSDTDVTVLEKLVVDASGGSDVVYHGDPESIDIDADPSADVVHR
jgi:hypothetical protein